MQEMSLVLVFVNLAYLSIQQAGGGFSTNVYSDSVLNFLISCPFATNPSYIVIGNNLIIIMNESI